MTAKEEIFRTRKGEGSRGPIPSARTEQMGISNVNRAVCDTCGEEIFSEKKQTDLLAELKERGWKGNLTKLTCSSCASRGKNGRKSRSSAAGGKENKVNSVQLTGNLTKDPVLRYSSGEKKIAICRFTLAVNDRRKNAATQEWEDIPIFIPIVVFGRRAENCGKYLAKGRKAAVSGRIRTGSYEKDGRTIYTTEIIAAEVEFLTPPAKEQQKPLAEAVQEKGQEGPPEPPEDLYDEGFFPMEEEDIPF